MPRRALYIVGEDGTEPKVYLDALSKLPDPANRFGAVLVGVIVALSQPLTSYLHPPTPICIMMQSSLDSFLTRLLTYIYFLLIFIQVSVHHVLWFRSGLLQIEHGQNAKEGTFLPRNLRVARGERTAPSSGEKSSRAERALLLGEKYCIYWRRDLWQIAMLCANECVYRCAWPVYLDRETEEFVGGERSSRECFCRQRC